MYYKDWNNYYNVHVTKSTPPAVFELKELWVNYQNQHEFNPPHNHAGLYSFVVFMKIPTHWKEQHALPISANSNTPLASDFAFVWPEAPMQVSHQNFPLSPEDEGRMLFFPATLQHMVYPFYGTEEERITISGNINLVITKEQKEEWLSAAEMPSAELDLSRGVYEEKEKILKMLENSIEITREELKMMKKEREKEG